MVLWTANHDHQGMARKPLPSSERPLVLVNFGLAVRQFRKARGMTQEAFADACEIDRSYMGGIERGERNLALVNVARIIETLEMKPSEFFKALDATEEVAKQ